MNYGFVIKMVFLYFVFVLPLELYHVSQANAGLGKGVEWREGFAGIGNIPKNEESDEEKFYRELALRLV
jgi:hypothetical protein